MTDIAEKKDTFKKHVRALLVSSPVELTVKELQRDFHDFIGINLDFRSIGYPTIEDFFRDIQDAVNISWRNGMMTVRAKSDETDQHISKLVSRQKVNNKKKYAVYRNRNQPQQYSGQNSGPPRFQDRFRSVTNQAPPKRIIPAYVRNQIHGLFQSFPNGLMLNEIDIAFGRKYGTRLLFRNYGFDSMCDLFSMLPDMVQVQSVGYEQYRILPIGRNHRVLSQQHSEPQRQHYEPQLQHFELQRQHSEPRSQHFELQSQHSEPRRQHSEPQRQYSEPQRQVANDRNDNNHLQEEASGARPSKGRGRRRQASGNSEGRPGVDNQSVKSGGSGGSGTSKGSSKGSSKSARTQERIEVIEQEIRQLLEKTPGGVWAARLPHEYTDLFGKPLDYQDFGYLSVVDFVDCMPDTVRIERPSPHGDWLLYDARQPVQESSKQATSTISAPRKRHISKTILEETITKIESVLESRPYGIPFGQFNSAYKELIGQEIPIKELGFEAPHQLLLSLADTVLQVAYIDEVGLVLFSLDADITQAQAEDTAESPYTPTEETSQPSGYPAGVVGPGCHYMPVMCPGADQYTALYVSNIINPGLFWVILRQKGKSLALENLMDKLDHVYSKAKDDEYQLPDSLLVPGQVCATLFPEDNNWHRGVITGQNEAGFISALDTTEAERKWVVDHLGYTMNVQQVTSRTSKLKVYFVDYGNTSFVEKRTVKFLKQEFLTLPAQAVQARLANVHPQTGKWKVKSRNRLLELTRERPLVAYITSVKCQIMSLCLTDTNDPQIDIHINDTLVKEGHALFCPDDQYSEDLQKQQHAEVPNYGHVFGTTEPPRLPRAAGDADTATATATAQEEPGQPSDCLVKWVQLTPDQMLHIINLDRVAYVVSAEVASLIWDEDILYSMLKQKKMDVPKTQISSDNYPGLFDTLTRYEVKSMKAEMLGKKQFLSLYTLDSVPGILHTFAPEKKELIKAVEEVVAKFDPDSPYWKSIEVKSLKPTDEEDLQISSEDKQMALYALQIKRKRILQALMNEAGMTADVVNELDRVEIQILMLKQELEDSSVKIPPAGGATVNERQTGTMLPTRTVHPDASQTENQRVIQNIIASSTKPIATANIMTKPSVSLPSQTSATMPSILPGNQTQNQSAQGNLPGILQNQSMGNLTELLQNQSGVGNIQGNLQNQSMQTLTGILQNQSGLGSLPGNLQNQSGLGSLPGHLQNQSGMGSLPGHLQNQSGFHNVQGMMGLNNFAQQQRFLNPFLMAQAGMVPGQMNRMMAPRMSIGVTQSMMPGLDPILLQNLQNPSMPCSQPMMNPAMLNQMGGVTMQSLGRGQAGDASNMGLLPGLMPLLQNLSMGRGAGRGSGPHGS